MQDKNPDSTEDMEVTNDGTTNKTAEDSAANTQSEQPSHEADESSAENQPEQEIDPWEKLELEAAKWKDQAIRSAAELDNYRKRMAREKQDSLRYGNQRLLEELLPVLDNFDMGMQAASQEEGSMLFLGMDMVRKQLGDFLNSQNVEEIPAEPGGDFDPNLHEALSQEPSENVSAGNIVRVMRKGYRIGDRLLRPTNVIVAATDESETQTESE